MHCKNFGLSLKKILMTKIRFLIKCINKLDRNVYINWLLRNAISITYCIFLCYSFYFILLRKCRDVCSRYPCVSFRVFSNIVELLFFCAVSPRKLYCNGLSFMQPRHNYSKYWRNLPIVTKVAAKMIGSGDFLALTFEIGPQSRQSIYRSNPCPKWDPMEEIISLSPLISSLSVDW